MVEATVVYLGINWVIWQRQSDNTVITILTTTTTIIVVIITTIIIIIAVVITTIIIITSSECLPLKWYIWVRGGIIKLPPSVYYYMTMQLSSPIKKPRKNISILLYDNTAFSLTIISQHFVPTIRSLYIWKWEKESVWLAAPFKEYILQSRQIHFAIQQTNTFCNLDKYILQSRQIHFAI